MYSAILPIKYANFCPMTSLSSERVKTSDMLHLFRAHATAQVGPVTQQFLLLCVVFRAVHCCLTFLKTC